MIVNNGQKMRLLWEMVLAKCKQINEYEDNDEGNQLAMVRLMVMNQQDETG